MTKNDSFVSKTIKEDGSILYDLHCPDGKVYPINLPKELLSLPPITELSPFKDIVNHPSHYTDGKYEVIDIIEDQLGKERFEGFCLGNTIKYICRAGKKDPTKKIEDLKKAKWYLNHLIEKKEKEEAKSNG